MAQTPKDPGADLMDSFIVYLQRLFTAALLEPHLPEPNEDGTLRPNPLYRPLVPSELETVRKLLSDNSVTLASVQRGDFGKAAQKIVEAYPFAEDPEETGRVFVN